MFFNDSIEQRKECAKNFMSNFMKGYEKENHIEPCDLKQISTFLMLREIILYKGIELNSDMNDLNQWSKDYIRDSKYRIENHIPLINVEDIFNINN